MNLATFKPRATLVLAALSLAACQQNKAPQAPATTAAAPNEAAPDAKPGITVSGGVLVLPAVKGNPGAAYFDLSNGGPAVSAVAAISIDGAGKAEMHETSGGSMAPLKELSVKPGETVKFARGGKHVMVFDIAETVKPGGTVEMTLTFAGGDKVSAPLKVQSVTDAMSGDMAGMDPGSKN
ncbi:copper chaperone PCu(A)C [Novosphingobium sp. G106]|uniref:copper chaperone PCu(A)C n=1 Tax=Novosphingobium sp. G106 TaxID=2849500 RepID=UPI001C2D4CF5|nr:copper chaperone PCu(A)C [Novosphingobium sp. G106]MBV1687223.1 copper chaperone PCu(A)C [Novosphingobium sp. G106]